VALICFELADRRVAHLLVVDRGAFREMAPEPPEFVRLGDLGTMTWSHGTTTYLLAGHGATRERLRELL
jgi:hypothetical protein